jgi:hypothetical protein
MPQYPLSYWAKSFAGFLAPGRVDPQQSIWSTQRHGKYYAPVYGVPAFVTSSLLATAALAGSTYRCANPATAPVALSNALATTYVGLCLNNPGGSGVNLAVKTVAAEIIAAPAAFLALGLIVGWAAGGK